MPILNPDYSTLSYEDMSAAIGLKAKHIPMLLGSFLDETQTIMASLLEAIDSKDYAGIKSYAHSIKGSAGNLKFNEIYEMAKEMELSAAQNDESFDYKAYFDAIKVAILTIPQ